MGMNWNVFRIMGDVSHTVSKVILIWAIHSNRSAEGVSLLTQLLYILVFCTRYLDLFWTNPGEDWHAWWNFCLKIFYITSSVYIVFLMMRVFARTREREKAWRLGIWSLVGSAVGAPIVWAIFLRNRFFVNVPWTFSIILESVCVLPQLLLLRQTTVPTVLDSFYLVTLGSYRFFYILNWIVQLAGKGTFDPVRTIFGIVQTVLYIDFAWVYWSRQRVKLRGGGVVDGEDFRRSWVVGRVLGAVGRKSFEEGDEEERAALEGQSNGRANGTNRWGARGISISADDTLRDAQRKNRDSEDGELADPGVFEDESDDDEPARGRSPVHDASGVGNGAEWRDDDAAR